MSDKAVRGGPSWTYTQDFYTMALAGTGLTIVTDKVKGKGLYSTRPIAEDDIVHEETALCCSQNMDDYVKAVPVCALCLRSVETPRMQLARNTNCKRAALNLPHNAMHMPTVPVKCLWRDSGCDEVFCSTRCRETATARFHAVCCAGRMTPAQQKARSDFFSYEWVQNGVDFSDTAMLALRIVAQAVTAHRQHSCTVEEAFAPYAQLIRSALSSFYFSYLLLGSLPTAESSSADVAAHAAAFLASKADPMALPEVKAVYAGGERTKGVMCDESVALVHRIFAMDAAETAFLTATRWSELMGAVLLNGQDRSPPSPYDIHRELVCCLPGGEAVMREFEQATLKLSNMTDVVDFSPSSRGQGIYGVGCLLNHSCDPNLSVQYSATNDETLSVVALRPIAVGEELTISYIDTALPYMVRQQELFEHYLFECGCTRCTQEAQALAASK